MKKENSADNNRYHSISSFVGDAGYHYPLCRIKKYKFRMSKNLNEKVNAKEVHIGLSILTNIPLTESDKNKINNHDKWLSDNNLKEYIVCSKWSQKTINDFIQLGINYKELHILLEIFKGNKYIKFGRNKFAKKGSKEIDFNLLVNEIFETSEMFDRPNIKANFLTKFNEGVLNHNRNPYWVMHLEKYKKAWNKKINNIHPKDTNEKTLTQNINNSIIISGNVSHSKIGNKKNKEIKEETSQNWFSRNSGLFTFGILLLVAFGFFGIDWENTRKLSEPEFKQDKSTLLTKPDIQIFNKFEIFEIHKKEVLIAMQEVNNLPKYKNYHLIANSYNNPSKKDSSISQYSFKNRFDENNEIFFHFVCKVENDKYNFYLNESKYLSMNSSEKISSDEIFRKLIKQIIKE